MDGCRRLTEFHALAGGTSGATWLRAVEPIDVRQDACAYRRVEDSIRAAAPRFGSFFDYLAWQLAVSHPGIADHAAARARLSDLARRVQAFLGARLAACPRAVMSEFASHMPALRAELIARTDRRDLPEAFGRFPEMLLSLFVCWRLDTTRTPVGTLIRHPMRFALLARFTDVVTGVGASDGTTTAVRNPERMHAFLHHVARTSGAPLGNQLTGFCRDMIPADRLAFADDVGRVLPRFELMESRVL